ncbi:uncharacterized protein LOC123320507 [Coccinella septempunctata]|uniref:uncharacterized protein LOC123320507 n=1 Tax=Coccinella septempunctata TaxID=41139 RepID=UPI001D06F8EA|nr:uncharacterized protein LOC123320507 [Coccinella septempunctata]
MVELKSMKNYNAIPILQVCPGKITKVLRSNLLQDSSNRDSIERSFFTPTGPPPASTRDGTRFELRIVKIKLAKSILDPLRTNSENLNICWQIMDFPESILKSNIDKEETELELSVLYKIKDFQKFSEYLEMNIVTFDLIVEKEDDFLKLAKGEIFMSRALRSPKTKVYDQVDLYHSTVDDDKSILVGTLNIWYQLHSEEESDADVNPSLKKSLTSILTAPISLRSGSIYLPDHQPPSRKVSTCTLSSFTKNNQQVTEAEVKKFQEDLFLVLNRNKALGTTQGEIDRELKDRAEWLNEEAIWRRTLQEHAILSGKDPFDVKWRQWRDCDTSKVVLRSFPKSPTYYSPILDITIVQVVFSPSTSPYQHEEVEQIYVEYSFLNMEGPELESDVTLPKPQPNEPAVFDFKKSFGIDLKENRRNCLLVSEMIREKVSLKVSVVSEPIPSYEVPIQTCEEIGYSEVDFFNLVQMEENECEIEYPVLDSTTKETIGSMTVRFGGILALRKMALLVLAPKDYNIIV